jgi:hypothetical protein
VLALHKLVFNFSENAIRVSKFNEKRTAKAVANAAKALVRN